ncbi:sensor histidine kinase [Halobellus clavatus]|jgi:PAS domain S-box-containing protein|uniref:histidine kinase n=1 Tax=Halobellus clavatus TaxID=660517 RepID=A0A1H3J824_9EURY|nr:histidine kinase N-terminal 7TM domain-containing protein [Halobellus clavatus]SDY35578.1 PAS domain S-box-containing protein [Halobellus clavatus]
MIADIVGSPVVLAYTAIHFFTIVLIVGVGVYTARNHWDDPLGRVFIILLGTAAIWTVGAVVRLFTPTLNLFIAATTLKYVGIAGSPVVFLLFALLYDGRTQWVSRPVIVVISVIPALTIPIVATMRLHGLLYGSYARTTVDTISVLSVETVGLWYWLFTVYSWALVAIGSGLLIDAAIQRSRLYRLQLLILLPAIGISWTTNILYVIWSWPHPALDPTPIGFGLTTLLLGVALFSTQFVEISPVARSLIFDVIEDAVIVVDQAGRVIDVNSAAQPLLSDPHPIGAELTAVLGTDIARQIKTDSATVEIIDEPMPRYYRYRELSRSDIEARVLVFTEITEVKESQRVAEQAHEQLRQIVDLVPDPLYVKNIDDEVLLSNEANAELHGLAPEEIEGKREREIESDVENIENFDKYRQREIEVIETGDPMTFEEELVGPDGETKFFKTTRIPFETTERNKEAVLGYARDVTDLKEYEQELEDTKRRLEQSNEKLDQFAGVVSHDLQNPLHVILGYVSLLDSDDDNQEYIEAIEQSATRMEDIITDLLKLSRVGQDIEEPETVSLATVARDSWDNIKIDGTDLNLRVPEGATVKADRSRLMNVFENLFRNAREHNNPPLTIRVGILNSGTPGDHSESLTGFFIEDTGDGIPQEQHDEIFDHGYTTNTDGTGFGLSIVKEVVEAHGWSLSHCDGEDGGARFEISDVDFLE